MNVDQERHAVERDRWDVEDWERTLDAMPKLEALRQDLEDVAFTAPNLLDDVHQLLTRPAPHFVEPSAMRPAHRINHEIAKRIAEADATDQLRHHTIGDPIAGGLAAQSFESNIRELHAELAELQEEAQAAEAAAQDYENACENAEVEPGSPEAQADEALEALAAAAQEASDALDESIDAMGPVIDKRARAAAQDAVADAESRAKTGSGWGFDPGEMATLDPATRLALTERMNTDRMQQIAALFGRMRSELWANTTRRWDQGPDEVADVTLGNDLNRILPSELIGLCDPDLELEFFDRFDRKQLLQFELRGKAKEARGSVVYVRDSSGSMFYPDDNKDLFAAAFGMVLLEISRRQHRGFRCIVFAGPGQMREFDFGDDASTATVEERLAFAEFTMSGGTSFERPLDRAAEMLLDEYDRIGRVVGDIIFATDDTANVSPAWLEGWNERRFGSPGFRCYGITIGIPVFGAIEAVSDFTAPVSRLLEGADIADVFTAVTRTTKEFAA